MIMLFGDLLEHGLSPEEKVEVHAALDASGGNVADALDIVSMATAERARDLMDQGMRLSLELEKLEQRGISVLLPSEDLSASPKGLPAKDAPVLFIAGNRAILEDMNAGVSVNLASFRDAGCNGILLADRDFDSLLRNHDVAVSLREMRALLVSDSLRTHASHNLIPASVVEKAKSQESCPPKYVCISGSRSLTEIPKTVQESLNEIIRQDIGVLVGDSDKGVDRQVIDYLRAPLYRNVVLYTVLDRPRVNVEEPWKVRRVDVHPSLKGQKRQMVKDRAMSDAADWGMAIFDPVQKNRYGSLQVSAGTLRNTVQMLLQGKKVKFFYLYEGVLKGRNLNALGDLEAIIESFRDEEMDSAQQDMIMSARGVSSGDDAAEVKFRKILDKYRELEKAEEKLRMGGGAVVSMNGAAQTALPLFG